MGATASQVTKNAVRDGKTGPQVASDRQLKDSILTLVSLPAREELEEKAVVPELLSEAEAKSLKETQGQLKKALSEINYRLSGKWETEALLSEKKILKNTYPLRDGFERFALSTIWGLSGLFAGIVSAFVLHQSSMTLAMTFMFGSPLAAVLSFNCFDISKTLFKRLKLANERIFNHPSSPPARILSGIWNPLIRFRGLFYRGPLSPGAREYDKKVKAIELDGIEQDRGTTDSSVERKEIAKEALELAKEQTSRELDLVTEKLRGWENTWQHQREVKKETEARAAGTAEATKMLDDLLASLAIPGSADKEFLKSTASRTEALIESLEAFRNHRKHEIPQQPAMKYFARIISILDKSFVKEAGQKPFFDKFREALDARLRQLNMAIGSYREVGLPQADEIVP